MAIIGQGFVLVSICRSQLPVRREDEAGSAAGRV
jgi:hypothetical protein